MVPWTPQHESDAYCFPSSLHMVLGFFRDHHSSDRIRESIPDLPLNDLIGLCLASKENGTRISLDLMKRLGDRLATLKFEVKEPFDLRDAERREERGLPTILIYNGRYLLYGQRGGAHAGVFVGTATNGDPILNNPWVCALYVVPRQKFLDAWELQGMMAVTVDPIPQTTLMAGA